MYIYIYIYIYIYECTVYVAYVICKQIPICQNRHKGQIKCFEFEFWNFSYRQTGDMVLHGTAS